MEQHLGVFWIIIVVQPAAPPRDVMTSWKLSVFIYILITEVTCWFRRNLGSKFYRTCLWSKCFSSYSEGSEVCSDLEYFFFIPKTYSFGKNIYYLSIWLSIGIEIRYFLLRMWLFYYVLHKCNDLTVHKEEPLHGDEKSYLHFLMTADCE